MTISLESWLRVEHNEDGTHKVTLVEPAGPQGSGYDIGGYGEIYGDDTPVPETAYTLTAHGYFKKPHPAIVGWGGIMAENLDTVEVLTNKIIALEALDV